MATCREKEWGDDDRSWLSIYRMYKCFYPDLWCHSIVGRFTSHEGTYKVVLVTWILMPTLMHCGVNMHIHSHSLDCYTWQSQHVYLLMYNMYSTIHRVVYCSENRGHAMMSFSGSASYEVSMAIYDFTCHLSQISQTKPENILCILYRTIYTHCSMRLWHALCRLFHS